MKNMTPEEMKRYRAEHTIPVQYKGWGSPVVRAWIAEKDVFDWMIPEGLVIWKVECLSDQMWTPGIYEIYKFCLAEPGRYSSQAEAEEQQYRSCRMEYLLVRRETPLPEPETYEKLLSDFQPHLSRKRYQELLQELEGKTAEEKEQIIREAMDTLTAIMSDY